MENRKYIDCQEQDRKSGCSLRISGTEKEVAEAAFQHVVTSHGYPNTPEVKKKVAGAIKDDFVTGVSTGEKIGKPSELSSH